MSTLVKSFRAALCAGAFLAAAGAGVANAATLVNTASNFSNVQGGTGVVLTNTDGIAGNDQVRWGAAATSAGKSGLNFVTLGMQTVNANMQFTLGYLDYVNQPLNANTAANQVSLGLTPQFVYNGTTYNIALNPLFTIGIDETPNVNPCQYGAANNPNPCPDKITIDPTSAQQVAGTGVTFYVDGFLNAQNQAQNFFIAQEGGTTRASIVGHFTVSSAVPEPATWAMMLVGFGAVGYAARRGARTRVRYATV